jgi:beta propeller repeat protein
MKIAATSGVRRFRALGVAGLGVLALCFGLQPARATTETSLAGTVVPVATAPGDQTDPHISGDWVVYTDFSAGSSSGRIHYHNVVTGFDAAIPNLDGGGDSLSDISGTTVVYIHFAAGRHAVYSFDIAAGGDPVELDPQPASNRRRSSVGDRTVAWQDFGFTALVSPEIVVYDLDTHVMTRLTDDALYDRDPQVSADGNTVTWAKCTSIAGGCEVWHAVRTGSAWTAGPLTSGGTESSLPDTYGNTVVYDRTLGFDESDIVWQPVGGGPEGQLTLPSMQQNPSISRGVVTFESYDPTASTPNFDLYAYDLATDRLFRLTDTPEDESLNDVWAGPDGTLTEVWSRREATGDDNVYAETFTLPATTTRAATVQQPINADGSSTFTAKRGVVPVKFTLTDNGTPTCDLPPATITVTRVGASTSQTVDESTYSSAADTGSNFRISSCQYIYNLAAHNVGPGSYRIGIVIDGQQVGRASFALT